MTAKVGRAVWNSILGLSTALWLFATICYLRRPDSCAAVTIWPVWTWAFPGIALAGLLFAGRRRAGAALLILWLVYIGLLAEEPRSLARSLLATPQAETIRVVSINCGGGLIEAATEAAAYQPDIVLLQESPDGAKVEELGRRMFGEDAGVVVGLDASILACGSVDPISTEKDARLFMNLAKVRLKSGTELAVASVRLSPPVFRTDIWSPECWAAEREDRIIRREQVSLLMRQLTNVPDDMPLVVGGDMNTAAGDASLRPMHSRLQDAFRQAGRGWGNTVLNDIPLQRIDQIWISQELRAVSVVARKTVHSDHRLVVCEVVVR